MKTFRFIGMVLMTALLNGSFTACSSDDNEVPNENENIDKTKKLIELNIKDESENVTFTFTYDNKGRVISSKEKEGNWINIDEYTWTENEIYNRNEGEIESIFQLNNGLIESIETISSNQETFLTYNSAKQLVSQKNSEDGINTYNWSNNKITKIKYSWGETLTITYGDKMCKSLFPFWVIFKEYWEGLLFVHPELTGININYLPIRVKEQDDNEEVILDFFYSLDDDGYIESCIVKKGTWTTFYSFKWQ